MKTCRPSFTFNNPPWILCCLFLVGGGASSCKDKQKPPDFKNDTSNTVLFKQERPESEVSVEVIKRSSFQRFIQPEGVVEAGATITVNSPQAGRVVLLPVEEGMKVSRDQVIAELDNEQILLTLQRQLALVKYRKQRLKNLQESADYNDSEEQELLLLIQAEEAQFNILEKQLEDTRIKSPLAGRISELLVQPEEVVLEGAPVAIVVDLSQVIITAEVDHEDLQYLKRGARVEIRTEQDSPQVFLGMVTKVSLEADPQTHRFSFEMTATNFEGKFLPGTTAWTKIRGPFIRAALTIPDSAVIEREGEEEENYVFVLKDERAELRKVSLGAKSSGRWIIVSGLTEGEQVIISQVEQLQDGSPVAVFSR